MRQFGAGYKNKKIQITVFSILPLLNPEVFKSFYNKKNNITINNENFINIKVILSYLKF